MSSLKIVVGSMLAIVAGMSLHNVVLALASGLLTPRGLHGAGFMLAFFAVLGVAAFFGAKRLSVNWWLSFGVTALVMAMTTFQMIGADKDATTTHQDRVAAYVTVGLVAALGVLVLILGRATAHRARVTTTP